MICSHNNRIIIDSMYKLKETWDERTFTGPFLGNWNAWKYLSLLFQGSAFKSSFLYEPCMTQR